MHALVFMYVAVDDTGDKYLALTPCEALGRSTRRRLLWAEVRHFFTDQVFSHDLKQLYT